MRFYKKLNYPSRKDDDPYLQFLADGGYMVEAMAKLLFPDGREMGAWDSAPPVPAMARVAGLVAIPLVGARVAGSLVARLIMLRRQHSTTENADPPP